jgi:AcrR family transcriptional regulator
VSNVVRPYRGVSADERRADRRRRLVEACLDVVRSEGVSGTTVDRVCTQAKLTKRYFYEGFVDLDALLLATADELFAGLRAQMEDDVARHPPGPARTHAVVTTLIDSLADDPRLARLYVECPGHPVLRRRREEAIASFTEFVAVQVLALPEPGQPVAAGRLLATRVLVAGTTDLVTSWLSGAIDADRQSVTTAIEQLGQAV